MSITSLLPRLSGNGSHRIQDERDRLKATVAKLQRWQEQANDYFARLLADRADVYACWQDEQQRRVEAEQGAAEMQSDRDEWRAEALALRARFGGQIAAEANASRITVPAMHRDTSAIEDQATGPIDVRPLWEARDAG